jgi:hypothetical protein
MNQNYDFRVQQLLIYHDPLQIKNPHIEQALHVKEQ